ncbi:Neurotransmitter-gated ion-channel ligand-binding domain [Trinorchestia longiramus]|nr:Neurotransmitter-gated ion-channel ligand-binding domain [Trinorchestia longiramus]
MAKNLVHLVFIIFIIFGTPSSCSSKTRTRRATDAEEKLPTRPGEKISPVSWRMEPVKEIITQQDIHEFFSPAGNEIVTSNPNHTPTIEDEEEKMTLPKSRGLSKEGSELPAITHENEYESRASGINFVLEVSLQPELLLLNSDTVEKYGNSHSSISTTAGRQATEIGKINKFLTVTERDSRVGEQDLQEKIQHIKPDFNHEEKEFSTIGSKGKSVHSKNYLTERKDVETYTKLKLPEQELTEISTHFGLLNSEEHSTQKPEMVLGPTEVIIHGSTEHDPRKFFESSNTKAGQKFSKDSSISRENITKSGESKTKNEFTGKPEARPVKNVEKMMVGEGKIHRKSQKHLPLGRLDYSHSIQDPLANDDREINGKRMIKMAISENELTNSVRTMPHINSELISENLVSEFPNHLLEFSGDSITSANLSNPDNDCELKNLAEEIESKNLKITNREKQISIVEKESFVLGERKNVEAKVAKQRSHDKISIRKRNNKTQGFTKKKNRQARKNNSERTGKVEDLSNFEHDDEESTQFLNREVSLHEETMIDKLVFKSKVNDGIIEDVSNVNNTEKSKHDSARLVTNYNSYFEHVSSNNESEKTGLPLKYENKSVEGILKTRRDTLGVNKTTKTSADHQKDDYPTSPHSHDQSNTTNPHPRDQSNTTNPHPRDQSYTTNPHPRDQSYTTNPHPRGQSQRTKRSPGAGDLTDEHRLVEKLFDGYNKYIRPAEKDHGPIVVTFELSLLNILNMVGLNFSYQCSMH